MAGVGGVQIIRGKTYRQYTPEWYDAMDAAKASDAAAAGHAAGTSVNALRATVGDMFGGSSSSSSSSGSGSSSIPRITFPGGGTTSLSGGPIPAPGGGGGSVAPAPHLVLPDTSEADAAAFNRARDLTGKTTSGALTGLRSALASRGQLGGGGEFRGTTAIMQGGAERLADTTREQAIQRSQREAERARAQFEGDISTRGQDLSAKQAADALAARLAEVAYQGEITQRGQDLSQWSMTQQNQMQQQAMLERLLAQLTPLY